MTDIVPRPAGALRLVLDESCREQHCGLSKLTVLSPQVDPYRLDTDAGHRDGGWVAEQLERAIGSYRRIHWRGLHYVLVSVGNICKPNGEIYRNDDADWTWLSTVAGKAARWLGYISFERIIDNRNSEPACYRSGSTPAPTKGIFGGYLHIDIPDIDIRLRAYVDAFGRQPYALTIFGEKASLEDVLLPIARRFEADLYLPAGEISDSLLYRMAKDGAEDGRPMVVFVLADCDPAGHQMAVSIGRKLQALRDLRFGDLRFQVVPVALTVDQVRELGLPSTPLKETEKRADRWREAFGIEQTEIDALATLRPRDLEQIVRAAIGPFYDDSLDARIGAAKREWLMTAQQLIDANVNSDALDDLRDEAAARIVEFEGDIDSINERLSHAVDDAVELPPIVVPEAEVDEERARQASLISSDMSWADATRALIARKSYGCAE